MNRRILLMASILLGVATGTGRAADPPGDIRELKLRDWEPRSMMVTKATVVDRPKFPVVDVHNHLGGGKGRLTPAVVGRYLEEMDQAGVRTVVNLDGGWGERLAETLSALDRAHPGRFLTFALVNFEGIDDEGWGTREAERLEASFRAGAKGLKFHKSFGLSYRYKDGRLMPVDDPKLDAIWEMCARHKRPVVIHTADPAAFFTPLDRFNERWHELNNHPDWLFFGEKFPKRQDLLDQLHRVIARHPGDHVHQHPLREQRRGPGGRRGEARPISEHVRGHRRPHLRARPPAVHGPQVLPEVPGPHPLRHRHDAEAGRLPHLLPLPGDGRRILRQLGQPPSPGLLEHLRDLPPRRGAREGLPAERRADPVRPRGRRAEGLRPEGRCASAPRTTSR